MEDRIERAPHTTGAATRLARRSLAQLSLAQLSLALPLALALVAWSGAIARGGFAFDDREILFESPVVEGSLPLGAAFERDYWHHRGDAGHWRPLPLLSLRFDRGFFGTNPRGYHATNLAWHLLVLALAVACCALFTRRSGAFPTFGLSLFAVHPVLADAVAWISGRSSMISAAGGLAGTLALALVLRARPRPLATPLAVAACSLAGLLLALAAKEDGIVFGLLYLALVRGRPTRIAAACLSGSGLAVLLWLAARAQALGSPWPSAPHAILAAEPLLERLAVGGRSLIEGLALIVAPFGYPPRYHLSDLAPPAGLPAAAAALLGWLFWSSLAFCGALAARRPGGGLVGASALLCALCVLPVLQIVPIAEVFAPRFLYLPLLFGAPLVSAFAARALPAPHPRFVCATLLIAVACALAWQRSGVYASRASYWTAVLDRRPRDATVWNELGLAYEEQGQSARALEAWRKAIVLEPRYSRPWSNLGGWHARRGELEQARSHLERAVREGRENPIAHCNLGSVLLRFKAYAEAERSYAEAARLAPNMSAAWRGLGHARLLRGRARDAERALLRATELDPGDELGHELLERSRRALEDG